MSERSRWAGLVVLMLAGCGTKGSDSGSDGAGVDTETAEAVWDEIGGYTTWPQATGYEGILPSTSVHGQFVQIWLNDLALDAVTNGTALPDGAILVKEDYPDESGASVNAISVLKKIDGYSAEHNDIFWAQYTTSGDIRVAGEPEGCYACHEGTDTDGDGVTFNQ